MDPGPRRGALVGWLASLDAIESVGLVGERRPTLQGRVHDDTSNTVNTYHNLRSLQLWIPPVNFVYPTSGTLQLEHMETQDLSLNIDPKPRSGMSACKTHGS